MSSHVTVKYSSLPTSLRYKEGSSKGSPLEFFDQSKLIYPPNINCNEITSFYWWGGPRDHPPNINCNE